MVKEVKYLSDLTSEERKQFRDKYDHFFFDIDGTLIYLSSLPIPGVKEAVTAISDYGINIHVISDTCLYSRSGIAKKVQASFPFIKTENIITCSMLLADYLQKIGYKKKIYAIGAEDGIVTDLREAGFEVFSDPVVKQLSLQDVMKTKIEPGVGAVVVGADINFSYLKMMKAVNYLADPSALLLASHTPLIALRDPIIPAAGSLVLPISKMTHREPISLCKGSPGCVEYVHSLGYDMKRCLFIGDGCPNDIKCGNMCNMDTLLVFSGATDRQLLQEYIDKGDDMTLIPTYAAESVAELGQFYIKTDL